MTDHDSRLLSQKRQKIGQAKLIPWFPFLPACLGESRSKFSLLPKISLFMHVVLPHASQIKSDGAGFCNCTVQQSLFGAMDSVPRLNKVYH